MISNEHKHRGIFSIVTNLLSEGNLDDASTLIHEALVVSGSVSQSVQDILVQHVEQTGSLEETINDFKRYGDKEMYLPGRIKILASSLVKELESWKPKHHSGNVIVYHATSPHTANFFLKNGVIPQMKPWTLTSKQFAKGGPAEFSPGKGLGRGIYVGKTPEDVESFGYVVLALKVPKAWIKVPPELKTLGHGDDYAESALKTEHGGIIQQAISPKNIKRV